LQQRLQKLKINVTIPNVAILLEYVTEKKHQTYPSGILPNYAPLLTQKSTKVGAAL